MPRRRQVRFCYPDALIRVAQMLVAAYSRRAVAKALDLPLSTVYRWCDGGADAPSSMSDPGAMTKLAGLVGECEQHGFALAPRIAALGISLDAPRRAVRPHESLAIRRAAPDSAASGAADGDRRAVSTDVVARINAAREAIEARYFTALSCDQLARIAGMSRFHFIKTFGAVCGHSPYRYLMQVRVQHAKTLLGTTQQTLDTIASAVGFDTPACLSKAFAKIEGSSVSQHYRGMRMGWAYPASARERANDSPSTAHIAA